jgi:hypothetical protein
MLVPTHHLSCPVCLPLAAQINAKQIKGWVCLAEHRRRRTNQQQSPRMSLMRIRGFRKQKRFYLEETVTTRAHRDPSPSSEDRLKIYHANHASLSVSFVFPLLHKFPFTFSHLLHPRYNIDRSTTTKPPIPRAPTRSPQKNLLPSNKIPPIHFSSDRRKSPPEWRCSSTLIAACLPTTTM